MANDSHSWQTVDPSQPWHEIDEFLEHLTQLSKTSATKLEFYDQLLQGLSRVIAATGGIVWLQQAPQLFAPVTQFQIEQILKDSDAQTLANHFQKIRAQIAPGRITSIPFSSNPDLTLLVATIKLADMPLGYLEIFLPAGAAPSAQQGYEELLVAVSEIAADFHRNCSLVESKDREQLWSKIDQFACDVHETLDLRTTSYTIANQAREIINCDRVSVCRFDGRKSKALAVSGVDRVEHRSNVIRHLEQLVDTVCRTQEILWYQEGTRSDLPPQIQQALDQYIDQSTSRTIVVVPILKSNEAEQPNSQGHVIAALVVEWFHAVADIGASGRIHIVTEHSKRALINSLEYEDLPLLSIVKALRGVRWLVQAKQLPKTVLCTILATVIVVALCVVPADFEIETIGQLQPSGRYDIFAPSDGIIRELQISDPNVKTNQILASLVNTMQDVELKKVEGNLDSAELSLLAVNQSITNLTPEKKDRRDELLARKAELAARIESYKLQKALLLKQQQSFQIRSPIDGKVLTWDVIRKLTGRPVQRGQTLMTVADTKGPWVLELWVSDKSIGHVIAEQEKQKEPLSIEFVLASEPSKTLIGKIEKIAMSNELDPDGNPAVKVVVAVDRSQIDQPRPGNTASAKIHCGRRAIGYVWFHELWETIQTTILF